MNQEFAYRYLTKFDFFLWLFTEDDGASGEVPGSGVKESSEYTVPVIKNVDENKCEPNPCHNGGVCVQNYNLIDGYQCECADDFGGITCNGRFRDISKYPSQMK